MNRCLAGLFLILSIGCGSDETPPPVPDAAASAPAPAETRKILEGLRSKNPRLQFAALGALGRFPSVARSQRDQIEQIQATAQDLRVREKAGQLLEEISQDAEGEGQP